MSVVPADEGSRTDDPRQIFARNSELAIALRSGREHDRIVEREKLVKLHVLAHADVAEEVHAVTRERAIEYARHSLRALMIGRNTVPDKAEGNGELLQ